MTNDFKETKSVEHGEDQALDPPEADTDAYVKQLLAKARRGGGNTDADEDEIEAPQNQQFDEEFKMEVRYYYDASMLKLHENSHEKAQARVHEIHEHTAVILRHESIGRKVHIETLAEPVFIDKRRNANGVRLEGFVRWLQQEGEC